MGFDDDWGGGIGIVKTGEPLPIPVYCGQRGGEVVPYMEDGDPVDRPLGATFAAVAYYQM